jgi:hypothetical protein
VNLLKIEHQLASLRSPRWPSELGAIDQNLARQGQALYAHLLRGLSRDHAADQPLRR